MASCEGDDILTKIPNEELPELLEIYKKHITELPHAVSLINLHLTWLKEGKGQNIFRFYSVKNGWRADGTFVAVKEIETTYDVFTFTLNDSCTKLRDGLMNTKIIEYHRIHLFSMVHSKHFEMINEIVNNKGLIYKRAQPVDMFSIPKSIAANFQMTCPEDVYIKKLDASMGDLINSLWPVRYENSEKYIKKILELNGGYGVFLKENDELVSWVLKNNIGQIGTLQTLEGHMKKGYGATLVKALAKEIAGQDGNNPFATVDLHNNAAQTLFKNLGFTSKGICYYVYFY